MPHYIVPVQWQNVDLQRNRLSPELISWLLHSDSLTKRLRQHCDNFDVKVLQQTWQRPRYDEKEILHLTTRENVFVREVALVCDEKICVFAHSVFPKKTLQGKGWRLRSLKAKPLIEILTNDRLLTRSQFEIAMLKEGHSIYQRAVNVAKMFPEILWQRRSVFHFYNQPILVCEIFFPNVLQLRKTN